MNADHESQRLGTGAGRAGSRPSGQDRFCAGLEIYVVGGAVRDRLLGVQPGDRDWVVVGADPDEMARRGFVPVGGDFPVFLHPVTKEEYALARTERKSGRGYRGFVFHAGPEVTLEQDLQRRDLTINAMAQRPDGEVIDPCGGRRDLQARLLRHVGDAFAEDPVRILRLARFAARFHEFSVAEETVALCRRMAAEGEVDALVPERVWREISRGLMEARPSRMFAVLEQAQALERVAPEWHPPGDMPALIDRAAASGLPLPARYALACLHLTGETTLHRRLRVPVACADFARLLPIVLAGVDAADPQGYLDLIERCDGLRKPERFADLLSAAQVCVPVDAQRWLARLQTAREVDAGAVARQHGANPGAIREAVRQARLAALANP